MRLLKLLLIMLVCAAGPAVAGPFEDGRAAYQRGDNAAAISSYRIAADQGHVKAQCSLGFMYGQGYGVRKDYVEAVKWYRKAAGQRDVECHSYLAGAYEQGHGVLKDETAAALWYRKAAEQGDTYAQIRLGDWYRIGKGVAQDGAAAASWYRMAADQGDIHAQNLLGIMYEKGQIVPQDFAEAVRWYRKAAERGNASAQERLQVLLNAPNTSTNPAPVTPTQRSTSGSSIPMKKDGGTYVVPVLINNAIALDFIVDSGASDVSIPEDVVTTLIRAGTIRDTDFIGERTYVLADGSRVQSKTFRIRSLKVGDRVLENVTGSVASTKGSLLLGQSFLGRFKSWSIDNSKHVLVLE